MHQDSRPHRVKVAVWLSLASLALGILSSAVSPPPGLFWFAGFVFLVLLSLVFAVWSRQNWSRYVLLVLFVIGLPMLFSIREILTQSGLFTVLIMVAQTVLQGSAVALLFSGDSGNWYRRVVVPAGEPEIGG